MFFGNRSEPHCLAFVSIHDTDFFKTSACPFLTDGSNPHFIYQFWKIIPNTR